MKKVFAWVVQLGADSTDGDSLRLQKNLLVLSSLLMASLSIFWGSIYLFFDENLAASIPLSYSALSFLSIFSFALNRRYKFFRATQLLFPLLLPFF